MITQPGTYKATQPLGGKTFEVSVFTPITILPRNPLRRGAIVVNLSGNSKRARFAFAFDGQPALAHTSSMPLEAGDSLTLDASYLGDVSVCSDDQSTAITMYVCEW